MAEARAVREDAVSIVIPLFNAARWIAETIESVVRGVSSETVAKLIVVDDGSTDEGPSIARKTLEGAAFQWRLLSGPRRGPSAARNSGMQAATGSYVQFLDADDLLLPGTIERRIGRMREAGADVAYSWWDKLVEGQGGKFERVPQVRQRCEEWHPRNDLAVLLGFWAPPAAVLYSRRIVDTVGRWNESLPVIQDARFLLDAGRRGGKFVAAEDVGALYRVHGGPSVSRSDPVAFNRDVHRNAVDLMETWIETGELDEEREAALVEVFSGIARGTIRTAPDVFADALRNLNRLKPGWRPSRPRALAWASRILGPRGAMYLADASAELRHGGTRKCGSAAS